MVNFYKKYLISSYKRLYSKKQYSVQNALILFKNLLFLMNYKSVNISINTKIHKKIILDVTFLIDNLYIKKQICSDKFGVLNFNIGNLNMINQDLINNLKCAILEFKKNIIKYSIKKKNLNIYMCCSSLFSVQILLDI